MKKIIFLLIILSCVAFAQRNKSAMIRFYDTYILRDLRAGTFGGLDTLTISGKLIVEGFVDYGSGRFIMSSTQFVFTDSALSTVLKIDGAAGTNLVVAIGDLDGSGNSTVITVDDIGNLITLFSDTLSVIAEKIKFPNIPSDSTATLTGELWYNSTTGAIHRKF